ncbi:MAG: helix-turn-helix domain containing protein [Myxococcota bacterium]|nr:helix-turn-helix domain containing protein [Myxococcota bacterium]
MPRRRAWSGRPPDSPAQARRVLLQAARRCIERTGLSHASLRDVAEEAGVTRQTVYRYFDSTADLFRSAAALSSDGFLERLRRQAKTQDTPEHQVTECLVFAITELPSDPHLAAMMRAPARPDVSTLLSLGFVQDDLAVLLGADVNPEAIDALAELLVRLLYSFLTEPGPPRSAAELRTSLRRWLAPVIAEAKIDR